MGDYRLPEKRATIELGDGDFAGALATVRLRVPLGVLREIVSLSKTHPDDGAKIDADLADIDRLCELFVEWSLVEWNLEDHHGPIPATLEGLRGRIDAETLEALVAAWIGAVVNPPAPLSPTSSASTPSAPRRATRSRRPSSSRS